jgi:hypothetical protein
VSGDRHQDDDTLDASSGDAAAREIPIGAILGGRYRIAQRLGAGGMGTVYLAVDETLGQTIALKALSESSSLRRVRNEVLLAQKVSHENVCRTFDLEELGGRWFVKMEHVVGVTLARRARDPLPVDEVIAIGRQMASGLAAAHARGVVHRDLKPQNVMIEEGTRRVVLMDFGLAKLEADGSGDDIVGTADYMAPEQARGAPVDSRADLYALGCVFFYMLAGAPPLPADTPAAAAHRHVEEDAPDLRTVRREVPPRLSSLVGRLLDRDPAKRPGAAEVVRILERRRDRPDRLLIVGGALVAVGLAGVVLANVLASGGARRPIPRAAWSPIVRNHEPIFEEYATAPSVSPDGKQIAYASDRDGKMRVYVAPILGGKGEAIAGGSDAVDVSWAPGGQALLVDEKRPDQPSDLLVRVPVDGVGAQDAIAPRSGSPCGTGVLLYGRDPETCETCTTVWLRDASGQERVLEKFGAQDLVGEFVCDADGKDLAWIDGPSAPPFQWGDLWFRSLDGDGERVHLTYTGDATTPSFTPDRSLVYSRRSQGGVVNVWELPLGAGPQQQITFGGGPDLSPGVSPDGKTLVYNLDVSAFALETISLASGERRRVSTSIESYADPRPTPDGKEVIMSSPRGTGSVVIAVSLADGSARTIASGRAPAVMPNGDVVFLRDDGTLAMLSAGQSAQPLAAVPGTIMDAQGGVDGAVHIALRTKAGALEAWRVPTDGTSPSQEAAAPWCLVTPARSGWRIFLACSEEPHAVVAPPGEGPDGPHVRPLAYWRAMWAPDERSIIEYTKDQGRFLRHDLATGADAPLARAPDVFDLSLLPDGESVAVTENVGYVRRQLVTNFGDRLRRGGP